jgi:hypothetical protein
MIDNNGNRFSYGKPGRLNARFAAMGDMGHHADIPHNWYPPSSEAPQEGGHDHDAIKSNTQFSHWMMPAFPPPLPYGNKGIWSRLARKPFMGLGQTQATPLP